MCVAGIGFERQPPRPRRNHPGRGRGQPVDRPVRLRQEHSRPLADRPRARPRTGGGRQPRRQRAWPRRDGTAGRAADSAIPFWFGRSAVNWRSSVLGAAVGKRSPQSFGNARRLAAAGGSRGIAGLMDGYFALSVTTWVQAPTGSLVITGSEPPASSVFTVRWKSAASSSPVEPAVSLLISSIMRV